MRPRPRGLGLPRASFTVCGLSSSARPASACGVRILLPVGWRDMRRKMERSADGRLQALLGGPQQRAPRHFPPGL